MLQIKLSELDSFDRAYPMLEKTIVMMSEALKRVVESRSASFLSELCKDI